MKHLTVVEHGSFVGICSQRLHIEKSGETVAEYPLNRLKTITFAKTGISLSSNVIRECAQRGIRLFFLDFRGQPCACLAGMHYHAVTAIRKHQFAYIDSPLAVAVARLLVYGKIRNQRATLKYFAKYFKQAEKDNLFRLFDSTATILKQSADDARNMSDHSNWCSTLLGIEGNAASHYWNCLAQSSLLPESFQYRLGRGAGDIVNSALNYGYAILTSYVWNAVINAGLEAYAGVLHTDRPGKPSLVLDIMEVYRAWTVDRVIIKSRAQFHALAQMNPSLKRSIIEDVQKTFSTRYYYKKSRLRLESILQRQVYKLAGTFMGRQQYKPYLFRW